MACTRPFKGSEANAKSYLRTKGAIDQYLNIVDLNIFRREHKYLREVAKKYLPDFDGMLFFEREDANRRMFVVPNTAVFNAINEAKRRKFEYALNTPTDNVSDETITNMFDDLSIDESIQLADNINKNAGYKKVELDSNYNPIVHNNIVEVNATIRDLKRRISGVLFKSENNTASHSGYAEGNIAMINLNRATPETPIHELGHLFLDDMEHRNPDLFNNIHNELLTSNEGKELLDKLSNNPRYSKLSKVALNNEAITRLLAKYSNDVIQSKKSSSPVINRLRELWDYIVSSIQRAIGFNVIDVADITPNTTIKQLANILALSNVNIKADSERQFEYDEDDDFDLNAVNFDLDKLRANQLTRIANNIAILKQNIKSSTDQEDIDHFTKRINQLTAVYNKITDEATYMAILSSGINALNNIKKEVTEGYPEPSVLYSAKYTLDNINGLISDFSGLVPRLDTTQLTDSDRELYKQLSILYKDVYGAWVNNVRLLLSNIADKKHINWFNDRTLLKDIGIGVEGGLSLERATSIPHSQMAADILSLEHRKLNEEVTDHTNVKNELAAAYDLKSATDRLIDKATSKLITAIRSEYYTTEAVKRQEAIDNSKDSSGKVNPQKYADNMRAYEKWLVLNNNVKLTDNGYKRYLDELDAILIQYDDMLNPKYEGKSEEEINILKQQEDYAKWKIEEFRLKNNPKIFLEYASDFNENNHNQGLKYCTLSPKESVWGDSRYDAIKDDEVYKFIVNTLIETSKLLPSNYTDSGEALNKLMQSIVFDTTKNKKILESFWSDTKDLWRSVTNFKTELNANDVLGISTNPVDSSGKDVLIIPRPKTDNLKGSNIVEMVSNLYQVALAYEHKQQILPILNLLDYSLENAKFQKTSRSGANVMQRLMGMHNTSETELLNHRSNALEHFRYHVKAKLTEETKVKEAVSITNKERDQYVKEYEKWKSQADANKKLGLPPPPKPTLKTTSIVEAADSIINLTRLTKLGFNTLSATANIAIGTLSNFRWAARKRDFDDSTLSKASGILFKQIFGKYMSNDIAKEAAKLTLIMQKTGIINELATEATPLTDGVITKVLYWMQTSGEHFIHAQGLIAKMLYTKIGNSNLWDALDVKETTIGNKKVYKLIYKDGYDTELYKSVEILNSNGENISKLNTFLNEYNNYKNQTQGNYTDPIKFKSKAAGRVLMLFRTWLPEAIYSRFGEDDPQHNFRGTYKSYANVLSQNFKDGDPLIKSVLKSIWYLSSKILTQNALGKSISDKIDANLKTNGIDDLDIENMRVNIRELQMVAMMFAIFCILKAAAGDDDPILAFAANTSQRVLQDLSFFYLPTSAESFLRDIIPITDTIDNLQTALYYTSRAPFEGMGLLDYSQYKAGFRTGHSKWLKSIGDITPGVAAINSLYSTMNQVFGSSSYKYTK